MDPQTLEFYENRSREWAAALPKGRRKELEQFIEMLKPGAKILELGCGDGRDAELMLSHGFDVQPSDGSPEMARLAGERIGRHVPVMRYDELEAVGEYDGVWCHAALLHVDRNDLPGILRRIHRALVPGGLHFASYKGGGEGGRDEHGRYYNYLSGEELDRAYRAAAGWSTLSIDGYEGGSFGGHRITWWNVWARH